MDYPKLPENTVEYNVFFIEKTGVLKKDFSDVWPQLERFCDDVYSLLAKPLLDYIWHNEPFRLSPFKRPFPHVGGRTHFGDNTEDEWFIVYILLELSKQYTNTAISVYDDAGNFLLIEAVEHLPAWLGPENSRNRVWIHRGRIHIISETLAKQGTGNAGDEEFSVEAALACLAKEPAQTVAPKAVENAINKRINGYPKKISDAQHRMHCCVPASVAVLMKVKPSVLSAAIEAFYLRDPIDLRACKAMKHFPPETRVLTDVATSKLQYVQLLQQKYCPDKRTGWDLPGTDDPHYRALDLGVKIASGFEILCAYGEKIKGKTRLLTHEELDADKEWKDFHETLLKKGYLRDIKDSGEQTNKLNRARDFFIESRRVDDTCSSRERHGAYVLHLLRTADVDIDALKKQSYQLAPPDDDSWVNLAPDDVETTLKARSGPQGNGSAKRREAAFDPTLITESMKRFMDIASGLESAEFPDEKDDHNSMDTRAMDNAIGKILELHISETDDEGRNSSAMTDYSDEEEHVFDMPRGSKTELESIQSYLQEKMDRELAKTSDKKTLARENGIGLGKSSTDAPKAPRRPPPPVPDRKNSAMAGDSNESIDEEDDDYHPVNVNVNLLKNILESCNSQQGLAGPASVMLKRMGVNLPANTNQP
ncbi:protein ecdysoneless homolog isoform X2 [Paramacrobiotus metropolitanus]|nr:protein ecdysoneless homolog isoform X2 [Paramacrobiotus metropolitanus]